MDKDAKKGPFAMLVVTEVNAGIKHPYSLKSGIFTIGSGLNSTIRLKSSQVQNTHCILQIDDDGQASVTPQNTLLPTLLNGKILPKTKKAQFKVGDILSICDNKITYENNASPVKDFKPKSRLHTIKLLATPRRGSMFIKHGSMSVSKIPVNRVKMIHKRRSSLSVPITDQWATHVLKEDVLPSPRNNPLPGEISSSTIATPVTSGELPECAPINRRSRAHKRLSSIAFDKSFDTVHTELTSSKKAKKASKQENVNMEDSLIEETPKTALHHSLSYCAAPKTQLKKAQSMHNISQSKPKIENVGNTSLMEKKLILKRTLGDHSDSTIRLQRRSRSIANKSMHNEESSPLSFKVSDEENDVTESAEVEKSRRRSWVKSRTFKQAVKRNKSMLDAPEQTTPVTALNSRNKRSRSVDRSIFLSHEMVSSFDDSSPKYMEEVGGKGEQDNEEEKAVRRSKRQSLPALSRKSEIISNKHFNQSVSEVGFCIDNISSSSLYVEETAVEQEFEENGLHEEAKQRQIKKLSASRKSKVCNQDIITDNISNSPMYVADMSVEKPEKEELINNPKPDTRRSSTSRKSGTINENNQLDDTNYGNISNSYKCLSTNGEIIEEMQIKEGKSAIRRSKRRSSSLTSRKSSITSNKQFNQTLYNSNLSSTIVTRRSSRTSMYNNCSKDSSDKIITSSSFISNLTEKSSPIPHRNSSRNLPIDRPSITISSSDDSISSADKSLNVSEVSSTVEISPNNSSLLEITNSSSFSYIVPEKNISDIDNLSKTPEQITRRLRSFKVSDSVNIDESISDSSSSLPHDQPSESIINVKEKSKRTITPKNDLTDICSVKTFFKTPKAQQSPNVQGVKKLFKTPKVQNSPANNLTNIPRFKKLYESLRAAKSPKNDLTNLPRFKKIFQSPRIDTSPKNDLTNVPRFNQLFESSNTSKSPKNDLSNPPNLKKLYGSLKTPKSPKNDLSNPPNIKKLYGSVKAPKSPKNDLTNPPNIKKLFESSKPTKSPQNDLTNPVKFKNIFASPQTTKSPKNDLTELPEFQNLFEPAIPQSPKNDLTNVTGLKKLFSTPISHSSPKNDLSDVRGVRKLLKTPRMRKRPLNDLSNVEDELFNTSMKKAEASAKDSFYLSGIADMFNSSSEKFTQAFNKKPIRTYSKSPPKNELVKSVPSSPMVSSDVVNWVNSVSNEMLTEDVSVTTPLLKRSRRLASKADSVNSPCSSSSYRKGNEVDIQTELANISKNTTGNENSASKQTHRNVSEKKENQAPLDMLTPKNDLISKTENEDRRSRRTPRTPLKFSEYLSNFTKPGKKSETPKTKIEKGVEITTRPKRGHKAPKETPTNNEEQNQLKDDKDKEEKEPAETRTRSRRGVKPIAQDEEENNHETDVTIEKVEPVKTLRTRRGKKQEESSETTRPIVQLVENKRVTRKRVNKGFVADLDSIASEQTNKKPRVKKTKEIGKSKQADINADSIASENKSKEKSKKTTDMNTDTDSIMSDEPIRKTRSHKTTQSDENTKSNFNTLDKETNPDLTVGKKQTRGARSQKAKQSEESAKSKTKKDLDDDWDTDLIVGKISARSTRSQKTKQIADSKSDKTTDQDTDTDSVANDKRATRARKAKESQQTKRLDSIVNDTKKLGRGKAKESQEAKDTDSVTSDATKPRTRRAKESEDTQDTNIDVFKQPDQGGERCPTELNFSPKSVSDEVFTLRIESDTENEFIANDMQDKKPQKHTRKVTTLKEEAKADSTTSVRMTTRRRAAKEVVESDNEGSVSSTTSVSTRATKKQESLVKKSARSKKVRFVN